LRTWFEDPERDCLVIAEVAQAHDGSLGMAHAFIDAAAEAGAQGVKFQTHIAAAESTPGEPWRVQFSPQDETRYDYWKRMEFPEEAWHGLAGHAREKGLIFLSSAFSIAAVELLERVGVGAWKVGSGELTTLPMLERMARTGLPLLLSSGMSSWSELDAALELVRREGAPVAVLQCTTAYPCPPERWGLNVIAQLKQRYGVPVGFSDHSGCIHAGIAAATLGAELIEVHLTFSRRAFGPDGPASLTPDELRSLVEGVRRVQTALRNPVEKDALAAELEGLKRTFSKSVVAARALQKGRRLALGDLALKKPGTGIPAARLHDIVGRRLVRAVKADARLTEDDLDPQFGA